MELHRKLTDPDDLRSVDVPSDNKKEEALASAPALQPNFSSEHVTQEQLEKLQALRRRRLQLKCTNKYLKKAQQGHKNLEIRKLHNCYIHDTRTDHNIHTHKGSLLGTKNTKENARFPRKKPQKLGWGLDTKARWEQKGNM